MENDIQGIYTYQKKDGVTIGINLSGRNITKDKEGHDIITRIMGQFLSLKVFKTKTENHKSTITVADVNKPFSN